MWKVSTQHLQKNPQQLECVRLKSSDAYTQLSSIHMYRNLITLVSFRSEQAANSPKRRHGLFLPGRRQQGYQHLNIQTPLQLMLEFLAPARSAFRGLTPITYPLNMHICSQALPLVVHCKSSRCPGQPAARNCSRALVSVGTCKMRAAPSLSGGFLPALFQTARQHPHPFGGMTREALQINA